MDERNSNPLYTKVLTPKILIAVICAVGAAVFSGYSLGGFTISTDNQAAAVATVVSKTPSLNLTCVAKNPSNTVDGSFTINTKHTKQNPLIIDVPGNGACDPIITATKNTPVEEYVSKTGGFIKISGAWYGKDSKEYGIEAIAQEFVTDTAHPFGYLKVYFKDPSVTTATTTGYPAGYLKITPIFTKFTSVSITSSNGSTSAVIDKTEGLEPITVTSGNANIVYVESGTLPLIHVSYRLQARQEGVSVLQQITDINNQVVFKKIVTGGSNITWSPSKVETSGTYQLSLCPVDAAGKILPRVKCAFRFFNIVDTKTD